MNIAICMLYGKLIARICGEIIRCYHTCDIIIKFFFAKSFTFLKTTQTTFAIVKFFKTIIKSRRKTIGRSA